MDRGSRPSVGQSQACPSDTRAPFRWLLAARGFARHTSMGLSTMSIKCADRQAPGLRQAAVLPFCGSVHVVWDGGQVRGIQSSIQALASDDGGMRPGSVKEVQCSERAVGDDDNGPSWQPASDLPDHLAGPISQGLVPFAKPFVIAFGRAQGGQERQRPDPCCPRNGNEQHHAQPA